MRRDFARASARTAADKARALRLEADALYAGGRDGWESRYRRAKIMDRICDRWCAVAARS